MTAGGSSRGRLGLPQARRLRRKADFEAAYARGHRSRGEHFTVIARWNPDGGPRLGMAVAIKAAGSAVGRNRIRRLIRESFRLHQHELPACDLIVSAQPRARLATSTELRSSLDAMWAKVKEQCASSSSRASGSIVGR